MSRPSNNTGKRPALWLVASALLIAACSGGEVTGDGAPFLPLPVGARQSHGEARGVVRRGAGRDGGRT